MEKIDSKVTILPNPILDNKKSVTEEVDASLVQVSKETLSNQIDSLTRDELLEKIDLQDTRNLKFMMDRHRKFMQMKSAYTLMIFKNKYHRTCGVSSIVSCFVEACSLQLDPKPELGKVWFIPRAGKLTMQIGAMGWVDLITRRTDIISGVEAHVVYEGDDFYYERGVNTNYRHVSKFASKKIQFAYAVVFFKCGRISLEVVDAEDIASAKKERRSSYFSGRGERRMAEIVALRRLRPLAISLTNQFTTDLEDY